MSFGQELISLILYAGQQLGIVLAVGGQTCVSVAYLLSMRDGVLDATEARFSHAVHTVLLAGLGLIVLSGLGITLLHFFVGEFAILFSPAYLFKWILIILAGLFALGVGKGLIEQWIAEGIAGGTWYALFFLHILAPVTSWENLLMLYAAWLAAFALCWSALVFGTREKASLGAVIKPAPIPAPKPPLPKVPLPQKPPIIPDIPSIKIQPPPPIQKPLAPDSPKPKAPVEVTLTPPKILAQTPAPPPTPPLQPPKAPAVVDPDAHPNLPALRIMPKTPQDIANEHRPAVVKTD